MAIGHLNAVAAALAAVVLSACETFPGGGFGGSSNVNYAAGSALGARLANDDRRMLAERFQSAMQTGGDNARITWAGTRARGVIMPGSYLLANLRSHPDKRLQTRKGLDLTHALETELGLYVTTSNSNVRTGPSTARRIAEVLPAGTGVDVVGKIVGQPWMLVAVDDQIRGYLHDSLVIKAPGTELELAGGPRRKPTLCRAFTQRLSAYGQVDEWQGAACLTGGDEGIWRLAPPEPEEAPEDDELLGL